MSFIFSLQGQGLYTRMDLDKFYSLVYGEDIASIDADITTAGYDTTFSYWKIMYIMKNLLVLLTHHETKFLRSKITWTNSNFSFTNYTEF